jgi:hypothetical protein
MVVRLFPGRVFASGGCDEVVPPSRRSTPVICSRRVLNAAWVDHVDLEMAAVMKALFAFVPGHAAGSRAFAASESPGREQSFLQVVGRLAANARPGLSARAVRQG